MTATLVACQPLVVTLLAWPLLGQRSSLGRILLAALGMAEGGLMVLDGGLALDLASVVGKSAQPRQWP